MALVEGHGLFGLTRLIVGVFLLYLFDQGLYPGHPPGHPDLFESQWKGGQADYDSEHQDGESKVAEQDGIQEHQAVCHGLQDELVPDEADKFQHSLPHHSVQRAIIEPSSSAD